MNPPRKRRFKPQLQLLLIASLVVAAIAIVKQFNVRELVQAALIWVESLGVFGPIVFILIYNVATVLFIPAAVLTMGGGVLFGVVWGSIYVAIAATLGATLAFAIGRYLCREMVRRLIQDRPKFQALDKAVARSGFKIVLLTRLSPIFPFNLLNYAFGVTQVSLRDYILGSLGMIPGTVMYVYLGSLIGDIAMLGQPDRSMSATAQTVQWVAKGIGLLATVFVSIYLARIAKKALDETV